MTTYSNNYSTIILTKKASDQREIEHIPPDLESEKESNEEDEPEADGRSDKNVETGEGGPSSKVGNPDSNQYVKTGAIPKSRGKDNSKKKSTTSVLKQMISTSDRDEEMERMRKMIVSLQVTIAQLTNSKSTTRVRHLKEMQSDSSTTQQVNIIPSGQQGVSQITGLGDQQQQRQSVYPMRQYQPQQMEIGNGPNLQQGLSSNQFSQMPTGYPDPNPGYNHYPRFSDPMLHHAVNVDDNTQRSPRSYDIPTKMPRWNNLEFDGKKGSNITEFIFKFETMAQMSGVRNLEFHIFNYLTGEAEQFILDICQITPKRYVS